MIFKPISREEFERMSLDERMAYLHLLMTDIRKKLDDTRRQQQDINAQLYRKPDGEADSR